MHVDPDGELKAVYRKLHMFDVEVGGRVYRESELEEPGEEIVLSRDRRRRRSWACRSATTCAFPSCIASSPCAARARSRCPAAFTLATTRDHWETLLRARAIENQAFVIAANQIGAHPGGNRSGGRSMIVDPWGIVLAQAPDGEGHIVAELDLERQREIRAQLPSLANRRADAYRWPEEVRA